MADATQGFNNGMNNIAQLESFVKSLPATMAAADRGENPRRLPKSLALQKARIDPNTLATRRYLVVDLPRHDSYQEWLEGYRPPPTLLMADNETGRTNLLFGLADGVYWTAKDTSATRYLGWVEAGLKSLFHANQDHAGKLVYNPTKDDLYFVQGWAGKPYTLAELAAFSGVKPKVEDDVPSRGLGRDVNLFHWLAKWAYPHCREYGELRLWDDALQGEAEVLNQFSKRLPQLEVDRYVELVRDWTWAHIRLKFADWQARGRAKGNPRQATRAEVLAEAIRAYRLDHPTLAQRAIAEKFKVTQKTVWRALTP